MKEVVIPNEGNESLEGIKKVMYAPNDSGEFEKHKYSSKVEEYCTKLAVEEYEILERQALKDIEAKIASPIAYYMYKNRMDIATLSSVVGLFSFRVKRHLKLKHFKKLSDKVLQKYADAFYIKIEDLKDFDVRKF
jgi:hypothetical protein